MGFFRRSAQGRQASLGLLEIPATFHREVGEDILGDDGLLMIDGAMESLVEEQVATSCDDVVDENLRNTSDEDKGETQDATPSSSPTSITAGSSSSPLTPSNCLNRMRLVFDTIIRHRSCSRHSWSQSRWPAYPGCEREALVSSVASREVT